MQTQTSVCGKKAIWHYMTEESAKMVKDKGGLLWQISARTVGFMTGIIVRCTKVRGVLIPHAPLGGAIRHQRLNSAGNVGFMTERIVL